MSQIISFSVDKEFADDLDNLIKRSGYHNRSKFLRDASLSFAKDVLNDDLENLDEDVMTEGTLVIYYQHGVVESKLTELRHAKSISVNSYNHNCLPISHNCVDTMQVNGQIGMLKAVIDKMKNTRGIDRVVFVAAPMREDGCC